MNRYLGFALGLSFLVPVAAACGGDDGGPGRRLIQITQADEGCTPATVELRTGEKVTFEVKNQGGKDREFEGIEGTKVEEVIVPSGRTRNIDFTAPSQPGKGKIKCYVPGGNSTIIELAVTGEDISSSAKDLKISEKSAQTKKAPKDTVNVSLVEWAVLPDKAEVAAGPIKFTAKNDGKTDFHELAVLRIKSDGSYDNRGEIEDLELGQSGEIVLDLSPGKYLLACVIAAGERGSKEDHFKRGMQTPFEVK